MQPSRNEVGTRLPDFTLMLLRAVTGAFLVHGTLDNVVRAARMQEFVSFLNAHGFTMPHVMAPLSVYAQFACGLLLVLGLMTRVAGLIVALNFVVAVVMVHWQQDFRGWWPALVLVLLGLHFAAQGSGRYGLDAVLESRRRGRSQRIGRVTSGALSRPTTLYWHQSGIEPASQRGDPWGNTGRIHNCRPRCGSPWRPRAARSKAFPTRRPTLHESTLQSRQSV